MFQMVRLLAVYTGMALDGISVPFCIKLNMLKSGLSMLLSNIKLKKKTLFKYCQEKLEKRARTHAANHVD